MMCTSPLIRIEAFFFVTYCYKISVNGLKKNGSFVIGIRAQTSESSDTVENKDKPQSNCKRARNSQLSSNTNNFKHDSK